MKKLLLVLAVAAAVAIPAASAGGWATVGLSSLPPSGLKANQDWPVDITVLQHGRTPLEGLTPKVRIHSGSTVHEVVAGPTAKAGVYRASVVFPAAGRWDYEVLDGFINEVPHTFPAVEIGGAGSPAAPAATTAPPAPAPAADSGGGIAAGWLVGAGAALLLALAVLGLGRRRRGHGAMPHTPEPAA